MTYKAVNPQFYSHLSLPVDPVSPPSKVHTTNGSYLTTFIACPPSSYVLLVEALGTAPKSSSAFNSYHQTVSYLYHVGGYLSRTKLRFLQIFFLIQIYQVLEPNPENLDLNYQLPKQHLIFRHGLYNGLMLFVLETA